MTVNVNWILYLGDLPNTFSYNYDNLASMKMFVGPGATEWSAPVAIPPEDSVQIAEGILTLYIWGRVDYEDVFDETRPHFTEWCYKFNIIQGTRENSEQFVAYGDHNRSD